MKFNLLSKYITIIFVSLIGTKAFSDMPIAFIDLNYIVNQSDAGISINKQLTNLNTKNNKQLKKKEDDLLSKEKKLISQKNLLSKEDFQKEVISLRKEIKEFSNSSIAMNKKTNELLRNSHAKLMKSMNPIFAEYAKKNAISMLIQKKNIIIGKTELDITKDILIIVNKKIKKIDIQ